MSSFIVKLEAFQEIPVSIASVSTEFQKFLNAQHMNCLYVEKRGTHLIYFVFGPIRPTMEIISFIGNYLNFLYSSVSKYYISIGKTVQGVNHAYEAYESAVILMQSSFFFPNQTIVTSSLIDSIKNKDRILSDSLANDLSEALLAKEETAVSDSIQELFAYFHKNHTLFQNQAKDLYYKLFLSIENAHTHQQLTSTLSEKDKNISETMERCFTYEELHQVLLQRVEQYFEDIQNISQENSTIFLIRDYISKHYADETLSVKDISSHVFLSASYVCTFFKNETGQTLNQYLTEYRMEKAKQLLCDPRYKITEISSRVGYSDGNYFGKSFKKYCGYSPSEFREKMTK